MTNLPCQLSTCPRRIAGAFTRRIFQPERRLCSISAVLLFGSSLAIAPTPSAADITIVRPPPLIDLARVTVAAKQAELGTDPRALFEYVRDDIRLDSYKGALRGARGTLFAQAGNSLDKSILLHQLLESAGVDCRYARGMVDRSRADELRAAMLRASAAPSANAPLVDPQAKGALDAIFENTTSHYRTIMAALGSAAVDLPDRRPAIDQELSAELADHFWLQCRIDDAWIDLDPSFPEAQVGRSLVSANETFEALPEHLFHRVRIGIDVERWASGHPERQRILSVEVRAADLSGEPFFITHQKSSWDSSIATALAAFAASSSESKIKPVLIHSGLYSTGDDFTFAARGQSSSPPPVKSLGGLAAALDGISNDGQDSVVAEWLNVEFHAPGTEVAHVERAIFDRIGLVARQQKATTPPPARLEVEDPLSAVYCLSFYTGGPVNRALLAQGTGTSSPESIKADHVSTLFDTGQVLASINTAIAILSAKLVDPLTADGKPVFYGDASPRLIISSLHRGSNVTRVSVDLARAEARAFSADARPANDFKLRVLKGVLDGELERTVPGLLLRPPDNVRARTQIAPYSTVSLVELAARQGMKLAVLRDPAEPLPASFSEEASVRIADDLKRGRVVVVPSEAVAFNGGRRVAWWSIDRATGNTLGVTEDGLHQANTEYVIMEYRNVPYPYAGQMYTPYLIDGSGEASLTWMGQNQAYTEVSHILNQALRIHIGLN